MAYLSVANNACFDWVLPLSVYSWYCGDVKLCEYLVRKWLSRKLSHAMIIGIVGLGKLSSLVAKVQMVLMH